MSRVTEKQLDSMAETVNGLIKNKLNIEYMNNRVYLCMNDGSQNIMQGTKREIYETLQTVATILYAENH